MQNLRPGIIIDAVTERQLAKTHEERERNCVFPNVATEEKVAWTSALAEQALAITKPRQ
jgi:hypothetical protein